MTMLSRIFSLFPLIHILLILLSSMVWVKSGNSLGLIGLLSSIYLFPLGCFRILSAITPIKEGKSNILEKKFSPWWAGHQIQSLFIAIPMLESTLRVVPGLFSLWLRAWGSKIGKNVYWTPGSIHYDRNLLEVDDNVVFGERSLSVCHVITPRENSAELTIAKIRIGNNAFIGAAVVLSPGVTMDSNTFIKAGTRVYPFEHIKADSSAK